MRIVIVGGSGYLGTKLSERLAGNGYQLACVSRSGQGNAHAPGHTYNHLQALCEGALAVVNLAGSNLGKGRWTRARMNEHYHSRIESTKTVVQAIQAADQKPALISMSASGFYGHTFSPANEAFGAGQTFMAQICADWEAEANKASDITRVVTVRMGVVLDPAEGALKQLMLPMKLFVGGPLGRGNQYLPWVHRDDALNALVWMITEHNAWGPYNVAAPQQVTFAEFAKTLGQVMHRPSWLRAPELALRLTIGRMADAVVDSVRMVPMRLQNTHFSFQYPSLREALVNLIG
jgi:uncharacterized protein (TIGR01777 family)